MLGNWSVTGSSRVPSAGEDRWLLEGSLGVAGSGRLPSAGEATKGLNKQVRLQLSLGLYLKVLIVFALVDQKRGGVNSFITAGGHARVATER